MKLDKGDLEYVTDSNITSLVQLDDAMYKSKINTKIEAILKRTIDIIASILDRKSVV